MPADEPLKTIRRPEGRPSAGEQLGGVIGCLALLIALALLIGLTFRSFWTRGTGH
jgi:hypothetical protein